MADDIDVETTTFTITTENGEDTLTVPLELLDRLGEGEQSPEQVVGDLAMLTIANNAHHMVHHGDADDPDLEALESMAMDLFEERFGQTFAEATGHSH